MRAAALCLVALVATAGNIALADIAPPEDLPEPGDEQTIDEYMEVIQSYVLQHKAPAVTAAVTTAVAADVANHTTSTDAPDGFAGRVTNALADFLPFFQGAVNGIGTGDDNASVTVAFNPVRWSWGELNVKGTIVEPAPFDKLLDAVVDSAREAQKDALAEKLSDFDNLVAAASVGLRRKCDTWMNDRPRLMVGRNARDYEELLAGLVGALLETSGIEEVIELGVPRALMDRLSDKVKAAEEDGELGDCATDEPVESLEGYTFGCARTVGGWTEEDVAQTRAALWSQAIAEDQLAANLRRTRLTTLLPALIGNQPQVLLTISRTARDELLGPNETVATLGWEFGSTNLNSVIRRFRYLLANRNVGKDEKARNELALQAYTDIVRGKEEDILHQDRFVASVTYKRINDLALIYDYTERVPDPSGGDPIEVPRQATLDLPSTWEVSGKLQWGRIVDIKTEAPNAPRPRVDASVDYLKVSDSDVRLDRLVARASFTYPISDTLSLPLSITYANRGEFLGQRDKDVSAHLGVTYKLKRKP